MKFMYRKKYDGVISLSFMSMNSFMEWLKGKKVVIEADGDVPLIRDL